MNKEMMLVPTNDEMSIYQLMAKTATQSQLFAKIGGESGLLSIMLMARELGLPPMQALMSGMSIIQGKVELSPRLMNSMIRKAGHQINIVECSDQICKLKGVRSDTKEEYVCSYSIDDARKAGLVRSGGGWEKFASDMLFARCLSRLARRLFADVISTAYIEGELDKEPLNPHQKIEPIDIPTQAHIIDSKPKQATLESKKSLTMDEFVVELQKVDPSAHCLGMDEYLANLSGKKGIPVAEIQDQALKPEFTKIFISTYMKWYERQASEASVNE